MKRFGAVILNPFCSNNCVFCGSNLLKKNKEEMRKEEINALKNIIDFRKQGLEGIEISGCDPIEYDRIVRLIKIIKKNGFKHIRLSTHGRRLADKSLSDEIIRSGLSRLRIPLYGSNSEIHDSIAGVDGSFEETMKGVKYILENSSIDVQISCLIMRQNKDDLINIIDLINSLGVRSFYFSIPCVANNDYSYYVPIKELGAYIKKAEEHAEKNNIFVSFLEIPFCVFEKVDKKINNVGQPPNLGKYCQPPEIFKTKIKDMPSYRLKRRVRMCNGCKAAGICDGFFVNDVNKFGTGNLKPV